MPRKSKCHQERRNSPSVASLRPISSCFLMIFSTSRSSTALSSAAVIAPCSRLARASLSAAGRKKLPTWSARNGALVLCIETAPWGNSARAKARQPRRRQPQNDGEWSRPCLARQEWITGLHSNALHTGHAFGPPTDAHSMRRRARGTNPIADRAGHRAPASCVRQRIFHLAAQRGSMPGLAAAAGSDGGDAKIALQHRAIGGQVRARHLVDNGDALED